MNRKSLVLVACMGSLLLLPFALYGCKSEPQVLEQQETAHLSQDRLREIAKSITVKVLAEDTGGSGTLIHKQGQVYTLLTNQHILAAGKYYYIQTPDGQIHQAEVVKDVNFQGKDLAVLQFRSNSEYTVASLAASSNLKVNEEAIAAGFPFDGEGLAFTTGKIAGLEKKAFKGGYQIGYTNDIQKGMSGGPVLNGQGEVIGFNGMHAYPLFGDPYIFEDGSRPTKAQKEEMIRSSWAVPSDTFAQLAPQFVSEEASTPPLTGVVKDVNEIAKEITVRIDFPNGNGSGVIIAHQGNTYYVFTAEHVVRNENNYEVLTQDKRRYSVDYSKMKKMPGTDLAVLQFTSNQTYRVATLANYELKNGKAVFASGWPVLKQGRNGESVEVGYSLGVPIKTFLSQLTQANIETGWLKVEKDVPPILTKEQGDSVDKTILTTEVTSNSNDARDWMNWGNQLWRVGRYKEAIQAFDRSIQLKPNFEHQVWYARGLALSRHKQYQQAFASFDRATKIQPNFYQAWRWRGSMLGLLKRFQETVASFDKAIQLQENDFTLHQLRGEVLQELKRNQDAVDAYSEAIKLNPNFSVAYNNRGNARSDSGDKQGAIADYTKAIELKPDFAEAYYNQGVVYSNLVNKQKAIADYTKAIELKSDFAEAYYNQGVVYRDLGNK